MNINKIFKEFVNPRLTTQEMENSQTKCGCEFQIITMFFDDNKPHLPTMAIGKINTGQGLKIPATWNQYGECTVNSRRVKSFDLIAPSQKEIDEAKPVIVALVSVVLTIITSLIIK